MTKFCHAAWQVDLHTSKACICSFKRLASLVLLHGNCSKIKMAAGGHFHFDNDHNLPRIKDNATLNRMTLVWRISVKCFWSYHICYAVAFYHLMDRNNKWQTLNVAKIKGISVLNKIMSVWSRYLKRFQSYSIFKCWPVEIQYGGRRPIWRNVLTSLGKSISIVSRYIWAKGDVCSICTFVTIHFVTYIRTSRHPSIALRRSIHNESA
jgi:hypothetical protein